MGNGLLQSIADNVVFVLVCVGVAAGLFAIAYAAEKYVYKRDGITERILSTRKITMIGLFSALAMILHIFDFPVLFLAPGFYKLDFSEIPALVGTFAFGPAAGVMMEFIKILPRELPRGKIVPAPRSPASPGKGANIGAKWPEIRILTVYS